MGPDDIQQYLTIVAIALCGLALIVTVVALAAAGQARRVLRDLAPGAEPADPQLSPRRAFGNLLRRYSEILGVEIVTGRVPNRGDSSVGVRVELEKALSRVREPGAVELLDEVGDAREHLIGLEPALRTARNGIVAMQVEWSIERWVSNPRAWLADCREQDRLERLVERAERPADPEPAVRRRQEPAVVAS